jgi:hypothetical protein
MSKQNITVNGRRQLLKWVTALLLAAAITGLPLLSSGAFGPLGDLLAPTAYACPHQSGGCG